jgi:hypothetical protein
MSYVFVAEEAALGRKVAIKVLRHDLSADISSERFGARYSCRALAAPPHRPGDYRRGGRGSPVLHDAVCTR